MTSSPTVMAQWRLMLDARKGVALEFRRIDGTSEVFLVSPKALRDMRVRFAEVLNHPQAPRDIPVRWDANRYQVQPGPNGNFLVGLSDDNKFAILKFQAPEGLEYEMLLPPEDIRALLRGLGQVLSVIEAPSSSTSH